MVDDLLDLQRMRYGRITLQKQRVDIAAAVNSALETAGPLVKAHNHTLRVSMPRESLFVMGDSVRLTQLITNLLQNAARYTLPGGRIDLTVSAEGDEAVIRVQDNGIGIAADILPHIFDYFVQEQPSSESGRRGLGIGLALARQLVELHNGEIEAKSAGRGQGSEFIVRMPLASQGSADPPTAGIEARLAVEPASVRRVLVIDDERDVADSLATLLRKSNHTVWTAYSGMSGIEAALEDNPDVALVDIACPKWTVTRWRASCAGVCRKFSL